MQTNHTINGGYSRAEKVPVPTVCPAIRATRISWISNQPRHGRICRHLPTIKVPRTSCTPDQPQYELSHLFFESNADLLHLSAFELPDEIILSILSHVPSDPRATSHCTWFRNSYNTRDKTFQDRRKRVLIRLSMTCRAMRLRFVPWVWECLEISSTHYRKS